MSGAGSGTNIVTSKNPTPMTDEQLAEYLHLSSAEAAVIIPKLTPEKRAVYDRMAQVEIEAKLWMDGLGPKPQGVLIDTERAWRRRKVSRAGISS